MKSSIEATTGMAIHQIAHGPHETDSDVMEAYLQITRLGDRLETLNEAVQSTMSSMRYVRSNIDAMIAIRKTCSGLQSLLLNENESDDTITCSANIPPIEEDPQEPENTSQI